MHLQSAMFLRGVYKTPFQTLTESVQKGKLQIKLVSLNPQVDSKHFVGRTYKSNNTDYEQLGIDIPGGEQTALALSGNGSVLAVGLPTSELNRGETTVLSDWCGEGNNRFRLSLIFDDAPEWTGWNLMSSSSREIVMEGGSYAKKLGIYLLDLNPCGKSTSWLVSGGRVPLSCCPFVVERADRIFSGACLGQDNGIFHLLQGPALMQRG
jgi:hypothetical protein